VVSNEDGGFFRHRGFNTEAIKDAIAENLHAGAYQRGAGTITMQLVRNLYLGHERTLSRKAQEVVLAWVVEHLTGVSKQRLLEIYLNVIEWGPDVHGADEACQYYFGHAADRVTVEEALFLATVVPAPTRWKNRFDREGRLRAFVRAQMHFIGRAMVAKGWLDAAALPAADSLRVELRGSALEALMPPAPAARDSASGNAGATTDDGQRPPR
jgi:membrane peptidoglycan carboxypeptidase